MKSALGFLDPPGGFFSKGRKKVYEHNCVYVFAYIVDYIWSVLILT